MWNIKNIQKDSQIEYLLLFIYLFIIILCVCGGGGGGVPNQKQKVGDRNTTRMKTSHPLL